MRDIKLMNINDYNFSMDLLEREERNLEITREEAYESRKKINEAYKSGSNNRRIEKLQKEYPNKYKIKGDRYA